MKITAIKLKNIRGFQKVLKTDFSKSINVFIGANNAGKSSILNSILLIQNPNTLTHKDITIGATTGLIQLYFEGEHTNIPISNQAVNQIKFRLETGSRVLGDDVGNEFGWGGAISSIEPDNLVYPYLSKRKVMNYSEVMNLSNSNSISGNFTYLYSKIDRLMNPHFQGNQQYLDVCKNILGFDISTSASNDGKKAGYLIKNHHFIELTSMGEGVANILGLITDLCVAENKIFLIEEPENDIHPKALKSLLNLIVEKSSNNQFFISTHSNIVMKYLGGSVDSKIFSITSGLNDTTNPKLFVSEINEVPNNSEERRRVLEDLGYDFFDFDLWKGWLFLEESSAEILIRDYFIKWFFPDLKTKLKTFSAGGIDKMAPKFDDFNTLFVFLHLQPTYKNKVWVLVDQGENEAQIINKMKGKYPPPEWNESNFDQLSKHDFEEYYPSIFHEKVTITLAVPGKQQKRTAKAALLEEVKSWIKENEMEARDLFKVSAKEIIDKLEIIHTALT